MSKFFIFLTIFFQYWINLQAQPCYQVTTYPDEAGFQQRSAGMLQVLEAIGFGKRSKAYSECPDTGLPVYTWAIEGEEITSPYTGTRYKQGPTGYFGPRKRNEAGQIVSFGGDVLKYDLPPAIASLLLNPNRQDVIYYLSIPGNIRQQYHFAAFNWARFYPLFSEKMNREWQHDFKTYIAGYPGLVGDPNRLLGGGGTENHKTMWRTTALVYAQHFLENDSIGHKPVGEVEDLAASLLYQYLQRALQNGNGEYDSRIYYPYSIASFMNLYDFSQDPEYKKLAQAVLDFYFATYGLKVMDGVLAGPQKRGYFTEKLPNEMETMTWLWYGHTSRPMDEPIPMIHHATTSYRPNQVISNITNKRVALPYSAQIARPDYHMERRNVFQESFYCSESFALGNIAMTLVDNPSQQIVWSLVAKGTEMPLSFGGTQPKYGRPDGHSPYTQTLHHENMLLVMTGPTAKMPAGELATEQKQRYEHAGDQLLPLQIPEKLDSTSFAALLKAAPNSASTWFWLPKKGVEVIEEGNRIFIKANQTYLALSLPKSDYRWLKPDDQAINSLGNKEQRLWEVYQALVIPGNYSGFAIEAAESADYQDFDSFRKHVKINAVFSMKASEMKYHGSNDTELVLNYNPTGLRADGMINGSKVDYENWADGGVYASPYLKIKDGRMEVTDGKSTFSLEVKGKQVIYQEN